MDEREKKNKYHRDYYAKNSIKIIENNREYDKSYYAKNREELLRKYHEKEAREFKVILKGNMIASIWARTSSDARKEFNKMVRVLLVDGILLLEDKRTSDHCWECGKRYYYDGVKDNG